MHYRNGREAKNGDKVVVLQEYDGKVYAAEIGILYDAVAGNDTCNGRIAAIRQTDTCPNLKDCLHLGDLRAALGELDNVPVTDAGA